MLEEKEGFESAKNQRSKRFKIEKIKLVLEVAVIRDQVQLASLGLGLTKPLQEPQVRKKSGFPPSYFFVTEVGGGPTSDGGSGVSGSIAVCVVKKFPRSTNA